jgi:hypothetical protein
MLAPRSVGSIDRVLREAEATLGPLPSVADAPVPQEVAPFVIGAVVTPRHLAAAALGPLIMPGSHFLELLVGIEAWSFTTLWLPDVVRRAIFALGLSIGEVALVEQSRPELIWPVDIILGVGAMPSSPGVGGPSTSATVSALTTALSSASSWGR